MRWTLVAISLCLYRAAIAAPTTKRQTTFDCSATVGDLTEAQVAAAAPQSTSCSSGSNDECSDASTAATYLNQAFAKYEITTLGQKAALISQMTSESDDFVYNINHFPGTPGQGTKAMLLFKNILPYALAQPELNSQVLAAAGGQLLDGITNAYATLSTDVQNAIRTLVLPNEYTFGAAPWFLTQNCPSMLAELSSGGFDAYSSYITGCVESTYTEDHTTKWCAAIKAMKPTDMPLPSQCS